MNNAERESVCVCACVCLCVIENKKERDKKVYGKKGEEKVQKDRKEIPKPERQKDWQDKV